MPRVLVLCLGNSGHQTAARAIEEALRELDPSVRTLCLDPIKHAHPGISAVIHRTYMVILRRTPEVWDAMYDNERLDRLTRRVRGLIQRGTSESFLRMMYDFEPDAVVCTQAYSFGIMAQYKKKLNANIPLFGVITDYRPHRFWVNGDVGVYVAPTDEAAARLAALGVSRRQIRTHGIPVSPSFARAVEKPVRPAGPRILVMGGSHGLGLTYRMIRSLDRSEEDFSVDVVTGLNRKLRRQLLDHRSALRHRVRVGGYVHNMAPLMQKASLILSKPGGLTCAEAMVAGVPMIVVRALPGQEAGNAAELVKHGVGMSLRRAGEIPAVVSALLRNHRILATMRARTKALARPDAAIRIAADVLAAVRQSRPGARAGRSA